MKKSTVLLIAALLGSLSLIALIFPTIDTMQKAQMEDEAYQIGTAIGVAIAVPSILVSAIGTIFAWVGYGTNKRGFALTSGILYAIAIVLMFPWAMYHVSQMILSFVAYGTMGKVYDNGKADKA